MANEPLETYINARAFWGALVAIVEYAERTPTDQLHVWPLVVNEAFCLELHLKCLIRLSGGSPAQKNHKIKKLFQSLSGSEQLNVKSQLESVINKHPEAIEAGIAYDIESIVERSQDQFVSGRYWHEGLKPSRDSAGIASNAGAAQLIEALNLRILDLQPSWRDVPAKTRFQFATIAPRPPVS
ncbi:MAG: hypothetical protein AB7I57_04065 [Pirellulales bacterium]